MRFRVAGIGEVLWDLLPGGKQLGGAPANFACHANALGAEARVVSRVGADELGRELLKRLEALGVLTDCIEEDPSAPTGTVSVAVDAAGQPQFTIHEGAAWDNLSGEGRAEAVRQADAICFGTLAQRSERARSAIVSLLRRSSPKGLRIFDINLRQSYYTRAVIEDSLDLANVLKVNETELPILAELIGLPEGERQIVHLAQRCNLRVVALTRGSRGSVLYSEGRWSDHPGIPTAVADTVGAGDAFTAAMALGLLANWTLHDINQRANEVAAYVASQAGATPPLPDALRNSFLKRMP